MLVSILLYAVLRSLLTKTVPTVQLLEEAFLVRFRTITKQEEPNRETQENDPQLRTTVSSGHLTPDSSYLFDVGNK